MTMVSTYLARWTPMHSKAAPRRRHGAGLKAQVLSECDEPGASVTAVAQLHGLNANLGEQYFQTPFSLPHGTPNTAPDARESVFGGGRVLLSADSAAENRLLGRRLRAIPCHQAASTGPENLRTRPTPAALVAGSPERSRLGNVRPLAGPGHGLAPEGVPEPAAPGARGSSRSPAVPGWQR